MPYSKTYNDSRFLMNPGFASPRDFLDTLVMGLDELVHEGRTAMMTVAVHARWSGQAARAAVVRAFLAHAPRSPASRSCAALDIARWWLERYPPGVERPAQPPRARERSAAAATRRAAAASSRSSKRKRGADTLSAATTASRGVADRGRGRDEAGLELLPHDREALPPRPRDRRGRRASRGRAPRAPRRRDRETRTRPAEVVAIGVRPPTRQDAWSVAAATPRGS